MRMGQRIRIVGHREMKRDILMEALPRLIWIPSQ